MSKRKKAEWIAYTDETKTEKVQCPNCKQLLELTFTSKVKKNLGKHKTIGTNL